MDASSRHPGYNPVMRPYRIATYALIAASFALVPWTLWLTYTLPSRHVTRHYDVAWIGFDVALAALIGLTANAALRGSRAVVPLASITGTMLLCDAWFDVVTSWDDEAIVLAVFAELPLAIMCLLLVRRRVLEEP
jgi:hypothetical protein